MAQDLRELAGDAHQVLDVLAAAGRRLFIRAALRCGEHHDAGKRAGFQLGTQPFGVGRVVGVERPGQRGALRVVHLQRIGQLRGQHVGRFAGADQQPRPRLGDGLLGEFVLVPLDGQQPLAQDAVALAASGRPGAQL